MKPERLCVLGSTGSIGANTLAVAALHPDRFEIYALSGHRRLNVLAEQCDAYRSRFAVVLDQDAARRLRRLLAGRRCTTEVLYGEEALASIASHPEVDTVMAAIVGVAGLRSCLAAADSGKRLLLANKEALVVGGSTFMQAVESGRATLLPVDSEHSAIHQCLSGLSNGTADVERLVLTASGGPFLRRNGTSLADATPEEAVTHPNWTMGRKISVDSATLMNKALEVIEARWLFDLPPERIDVVVHPQSVIHSMVETIDGSLLAQLGTPDMRAPIAYALGHPRRIASGSSRLNLAGLQALAFERPDVERFPSLSLAWQVLRGATGAPGVLNAANEEAVAAFLGGRIRFNDIHAIVDGTLNDLDCSLPKRATFEDIVDLDARARRHSSAFVERLSKVR